MPLHASTRRALYHQRPAAAGLLTPTLRGSSKLYVNGGSSGAIALPPGSAANDLCYLFVGHGYNVVAPTNWVTLDNSPGANYNGGIFLRKLTAGDVSAGTVTVGFGGGYYGTVMAATVAGGLNVVRQISPLRNGSGATARQVVTAAGPVAGDLALCFGAARVSTGATTTTGSVLQTDVNPNSCGVLSSQVLAANGAFTADFGYGSGSGGDYQAVVIVRGAPIVPGSLSDSWRLYVTATQGASQSVGITELELRATVGGADQTVNGVGSDSTHYSGNYVGSNAFDNSAGTYWLSDTVPPAWVGWTNYYTLDVAQIAVTQGGSLAQAPTAFNLQYYNYTTSQWVTLQSWTTPATWTAGETRLFNV